MDNKGRWLTICWEDKFDELANIKRTEKDLHKGVLFIAPPFAEITLSDGFWVSLNNRFGTMFDMAEEEEIENSILPNMVNEMKQLKNRKYNQTGYYEIKVGVQVQPEKKEIIKKISFEEFKNSIDKLCGFFLDAYHRNKNVIVIL